jgi:hypothetical protein
LLGPTCRPEDIEFACMWHEVLPYQEKASHLNSGNIGDAGSGVDLDIEFSGRYDRGPEIDIFARKVVEGYNLYGQSYLNQLLPSYMYDPAIFGASKDDWAKQNSIDIEARLDNAAAQAEEAGEAPMYTSDIRDTRKSQFEPYFARFKQGTSAGTFGEMGLVENGVSTTIDSRIEAVDNAEGSNT